MHHLHRNIIATSSMLFIIASILETIMHESGHFIAAILLGAKDVTLYHNAVSGGESGIPLWAVIVIKAAGPLASLCVGIGFHLLSAMRKSRDQMFLFFVYLSIFGYVGLFGYLMTSPLFTGGDTGFICIALGFPLWVTILIALAGAGTLYLLMRKLTGSFVELATEEIVSNRVLRVPFVMSLMLYPLLIGTVVTTLLSFPVPVLLSIIAPICSPFAILWAFDDALSKRYPGARLNNDLPAFARPRIGWFATLLLTIVLNRLLVGGLSW